ncbi:uncharacterized protein LOC21387958 [Morus notabilis]|uniref:uncharacterized protein LOC21387958 n=1 Tax=Morus notabilis TaxID=981085 RepID=UPI000CED0EF0|nr:uncharacterized protein LOC21387958 [Morus notabilis]
MEEGVRSGGSSGIVVKNRNSSGCLIVRRKGDALAGGLVSSSSRKVSEAKKEKKRGRLICSDSGSSDELLIPHRRRVGPETIRVCNDLSSFGKGVVEENEIGRKRERLEQNRHNEDGFFGNNGLDESERKIGKLDVFDFNEYDESGVGFGGIRFSGSMHMARSGAEREFETGSSRHLVDNRRNLYFERMNSMNRGSHTGKSRFEINREGAQVSLLRDKFTGHSDQAIRLQGKNGVLKVMVNKKKCMSGPPERYNFLKPEECQKVSRMEDTAKKNAPVPPFYLEENILEKPGSVARSEKKHKSSRKSLPTKTSKNSNCDSEDSDASLQREAENVAANKSSKRISCEAEDPPSCEKLQPNSIKEGKLRRGSGTEKQKLRERIRGMLVDAGWKIDYRPRRNRDYLDAVYINPSGTAYWSIIKAYDALQKQVNDEENEVKPSVDGSAARLIADEDLSQLTRKTRKKMEKEMKRKQRDRSESENAREIRGKRSTSAKHDSESMDSDSHDDKLSTFMKQGGKSFKGRTNENGFASVNSNGRNYTQHLHDSGERSASGSNPRMLHGRKSRKDGRCTLLVRSSGKGLNSETDGFVPYTGKRTLLSWLIDSGTVQLSQKVQYKNRRRTKVMLEGWITRDGIHCGCCSKILTISKFEIHAGSKLRQPYQNIFLDSGISLLQCQIDAWNRQGDSEHIGYHSVDTDGDDPNDDTCGICGDGGDLICCDGCPSTFHQSCLDIQMLPPGDWHCPNCTCKFCGIASQNAAEEDDTIDSTLLTCSLCEKKYHNSCVQDIDVNSVDSSIIDSSFCGQKCKELFEHLQKYIGIKHDLEAGFSWSLIRRTDEETEISHRGVPQRVECNSKLAVAMTVMDECFLPIVDRRSGINLIRNVLYNCGSNFNRLNYGGFCTAILERGDELISAASLRFHGTKLAEMPFIGTRNIYRRQGMCRRLFCAIESALCSLKVEKLVIPAISELAHTWTTVFGFTPLEETLKQEMRSMNMLVFPGIDMLQKILGEQEHEANMTSSGVCTKQTEGKGKQCIKPEVPLKPDIDSSTRNEATEEVAQVQSGSRRADRANERTEEVAAAESSPKSVDHANETMEELAAVESSPKTEDHADETMEEVAQVESGSKCTDHANETVEEVAAVESSPRGVDHVDTMEEGAAIESSPKGVDLGNETMEEGAAMESSPKSVDLANGTTEEVVAIESSTKSVDHANETTEEIAAIESSTKSVDHANETTDEVAAVESESNPSVELESNDTVMMSVSVNVSLELENPDGTTCSESPSGPIISRIKSLSPSKTSHDAAAIENKLVPDPLLEDNSKSFIQCRGAFTKETSLLSSSVEASHELKTQVPRDGTMFSETQREGKCVSGSESLSPPDGGGLHVEHNQVFNSVKENTDSLKDDVMDNSHKMKFENACSVPASAGKTFADQISEEVMETTDVSASSSSGHTGSSLPVKSDLDFGENPHVASDSMNCE